MLESLLKRSKWQVVRYMVFGKYFGLTAISFTEGNAQFILMPQIADFSAFK